MTVYLGGMYLFESTYLALIVKIILDVASIREVIASRNGLALE